MATFTTKPRPKEEEDVYLSRLVNETLELSVAPPVYWRGHVFLEKEYMNPSIASWQNSTLLAWRTNFDRSQIKFAWLNKNTVWLAKPDFLGIEPGLVFNPEGIPEDSRFEGPRLSTLSNDRMLLAHITYYDSRSYYLL